MCIQLSNKQIVRYAVKCFLEVCQNSCTKLFIVIVAISCNPLLKQYVLRSDSDYLDSSSLQEVIEEESVIEAPIMRVKKALQEIDERRTAKLQHMRVIGNVTYKKAKFASDMVHLNIRRVNFKWQMGNKIGMRFCAFIFGLLYSFSSVIEIIHT